MIRGREKFLKFKKPMLVLASSIKKLPYGVRIFLFKSSRGLSGNIGLASRYIIIKSLAKRCGDNVSIHENVIILSPENLELGNNISIHPFCYIDATGIISIGDNVSIAHASTIMSTEHNYLNMEIPIKDQGVESKSTLIHNNVWIASGVRVLAGTIINSGTIVAAGAVAKNVLKPNSIYGGIPAKLIKER